MDQQVYADQQNAHVLQYVNVHKWNVSFDIVRIFPLYQSSTGYNIDCAAVINTKSHLQEIADNTNNVKIVQDKLTGGTIGRQQKLFFSGLVKARMKLLQSIVILVNTTLNATNVCTKYKRENAKQAKIT